MATATVTSKRQVTLPVDVCRELRIVPGTKIDFVKNAAGETVVRPKLGDIRSLRGFVKYSGPPKTLEEIDEGIAAEITERAMRR